MIKWIWRIYKINGSFKLALEEIGWNVPEKHIKDFSLCPFVYVMFDGRWGGGWSMASPEDDSGDRLKNFINEGYEFKGSVGLKSIRKQKIDKITNE